MSKKDDRPRRAALLSTQFGKVIDTTVELLTSLPWNGAVVRAYMDEVVRGTLAGLPGVSDPVGKAASRLPGMVQREMVFAAQDLAIKSLWEQLRIVYDLDPDAMEAIGDAEMTSVVPAEVVSYLPHPNPLLMFPEPILLESGEGDIQRVAGFYVAGCKAVDAGHAVTSGVDALDRKGLKRHVTLCSTHDPDAIGWTLMFGGLVEDRNGNPIRDQESGLPDMVWTRTTVVLDGEMSLGAMVEQTIDRFDAYRHPVLSVGDHRVDVPILLARAINMLVYLGARNRDLQPIPWATGSGRNARRALFGDAEPPEVHGVGYRIGAQLRAWKRAERKGAPLPTGVKLKPHVRRSHPHTFRYGPGRAQKYIKWLFPIPVNMQVDGATETTIIPV